MIKTYKELQLNIYKAIDALYADATSYQEMWMIKIAKRELSLSKADYMNDLSIKYEFKIEFSEASFRLRWFHCRFVRNGGRVVRIARAIAVPRNGKYGSDRFKDASEWELDFILELEKYLCPIRNQLKFLMKMHLDLGRVQMICGEKLVPVRMKDRVEMPTVSIKYFKQKFAVA